MAKLLRLVLLYGGKSGEHEISLLSAASILANLDARKYQIIPIGIDKKGCCYLNDYQELLAYKDSLPVTTANSKPLASLLINGKFAVEADVVFPVMHGPLYEDGCIQGLLKMAGVAFVGCDVLSSAIGMDKDMARRLIKSNMVHCARYRQLSWHADQHEREQFCKKTAAELGWPLFVKPCSLGSSVGTNKVDNLAAFIKAVDEALRYDEMMLVEEFIEGREIELAVLENANPFAAPLVSAVGEIKVNHQDGFYSYKAKYLESEQTELHIPARLDAVIINKLQTIAGEIFSSLKCKGLARIDFFVSDKTGKIYFNEINTMPGFTTISMYPKLWQAAGLDYQSLLNKLIELALIHDRCRQQLQTDYQQK